MLLVSLVTLLSCVYALPVEQDHRRPCCLDSSSSSRHCRHYSSSSSSSSEVCCNTVLMDYDFNINVPTAGQGWTNVIGTYTADDGEYILDGCRGAIVNSNPFTKWVPESATPWYDHYKWFLSTTEPIVVNQDDIIGVEWKSAVQTFRTDQSPFPSNVIEKENDLRLAAGLYLAMDPIGGLNFGFIMTNDRVYGVYMKFFAGGDSAWSYVFPLKARKACEIHKIRLELNAGCHEAVYQVDNMEYFKIKRVGERLENEVFLVKEFGGLDVGTFPTRLNFGFGTSTHLDWYPACKDACCRGCQFPVIRNGLVNLGNDQAPQACSVIEGCPVPQSYYQNDGDIEVYHIWGQGVRMELGGFKVDRYACHY